MRGQCGSQSFFGASLPCPRNIRAEEPETKVRKKLMDICGDKWADGPVCCDEEQVTVSNMHPVEER
jgi:Niemann-Pick C1 protein